MSSLPKQRKWLESAKDPRWKRPYTELTYLPMQELLKYFRANGYKTYIVTGGGQDFVRMYSGQVYGIPPEQVVGTAGGTSYRYDKSGKPFLLKEPKLLLNDDQAGKPQAIHLMIGRRPYAAFGNSIGDKQMLEYTQAGDGVRLMMLVHHDDDKREYAYGPKSKVGTFTDALMNDFLNYIINTFSNSFGSFYDQSGNLRKSIAANQTILASGKFDWATLIANCETLAINYEQVEDIATNDQRQFQEMNRP